MRDDDQAYIGDDGEIHYKPKRKSKPPYRRGSSALVAIIAALIGATTVIITTLIPFSVGADTKPLICNIIGSSLSVCSGSIFLKETQTALEQQQTAFAQTQTAAVASARIITPTASWNAILKVTSGKLWQDTGIQVEKGKHIRLEVVDGQWRKSPNDPYTHGEGTGYICERSDCVEPLPKYPTDALVGQIGDQLFFVGQASSIVAEQSGTLSLRMNDGDHDIWDNDGDLMVGVLSY
ncbi:MAG: hypothetical protein H0X30_07980 [Anaerolineae bacterium]|nr:hypothetical protein [Anaerolineae bacterium]